MKKDWLPMVLLRKKTTVVQHINNLVKAGFLLRQGSGSSTVYLRDDLHAYFELPPTERSAKVYDFSLLDRYEVQNEGFLTKQELALFARNSEFVFKDAVRPDWLVKTFASNKPIAC